MTQTYAVELRNAVKQFGEMRAVDNVSLKIHDGEFFSLLGPSGCGKTTTLRMIAGFEIPTSGEIYIMGEKQGYRPSHQRPVNTVFQHYALFPHMTVAQNVAFGLEMQKVEKKEIARRVQNALDKVRLGHLAKRRPKQLSGGQQQRVALARALVNRPKVLLLDEPLGALDLKLRKAMQIELKALQEEVGITFIYVTHDQEEALTMSDRIAVMDKGVVHQIDTPENIYERPADRFVADFIGETNLIPAKIVAADPLVVEVGGGARMPVGWTEEGLQVGDEALLSIRPEKMQLYESHELSEPGPTTCRAECKVKHLVYVGTDTRHTIVFPNGAEAVVRLQNIYLDEEPWSIGETAIVEWDAGHARLLRA